ncbi:MAG: response regulator, partial [Lachnospiraceae bacterium]|nr:response regulator [Lachnospiraceae bacterium]
MASKIIIVDDDTAVLNTAGQILSSYGMEVVALKSGSYFLDYIEENGEPDLLLLDILMPDMDGFETLEKLRLYEIRNHSAEIPVIFLTADDDVSTESRGFDA